MFLRAMWQSASGLTKRARKSRMVMDVILLKAESLSCSKGDRYVDAFSADGDGEHKVRCRVTCISPLVFEYVNADALMSKLRQPESFDGIVFSSVAGVGSVGRVWGRVDEDIRQRWLDTCSFYAVGKATAMAVHKQLQVPSDSVKGSESGRALDLGTLIGQQQHTKPLLLVRARKGRQELIAQLDASGIKHDDLITYKSIPKAGVGQHVRQLISTTLASRQQTEQQQQQQQQEQQSVVVIVFFSPSGVNSLADAVTPSFLTERQPSDSKDDVVVFTAIGETTAAAVTKAYPGCSITVAAAPNPQSLLTAVMQHNRSKQ